MSMCDNMIPISFLSQVKSEEEAVITSIIHQSNLYLTSYQSGHLSSPILAPFQLLCNQTEPGNLFTEISPLRHRDVCLPQRTPCLRYNSLWLLRAPRKLQWLKGCMLTYHTAAIINQLLNYSAQVKFFSQASSFFLHYTTSKLAISLKQANTTHTVPRTGNKCCIFPLLLLPKAELHAASRCHVTFCFWYNAGLFFKSASPKVLEWSHKRRLLGVCIHNAKDGQMHTQQSSFFGASAPLALASSFFLQKTNLWLLFLPTPATEEGDTVLGTNERDDSLACSSLSLLF